LRKYRFWLKADMVDIRVETQFKLFPTAKDSMATAAIHLPATRSASVQRRMATFSKRVPSKNRRLELAVAERLGNDKSRRRSCDGFSQNCGCGERFSNNDSERDQWIALVPRQPVQA
jgi:hypothetical protein